MNNKRTKQFPAGKIILALVILGIVAGLVNPHILFFLTPQQQAVVAQFQETYFTSNNPIQSSNGSFDVLSILSLAILFGECWVMGLVVHFISSIKMKSRHAETVKSLLCNCAKYAVVIYAIIFGLSILGVNMVAVITSLGVLGLIVGFGAQTMIEDVITGLFIIFEGQFQVGDIVSIDDFRGTVTSIGIRTTQLTDLGGNIKIVNNSDIRTLTNLSNVASTAIVDVGISYDADLVTAEHVVQDLLDKLPEMYPEIFKQRPVYAGVQNLSASSVDLRIVAKVNETLVYDAQRLLNRELKLALDRGGIEIPFTQVVVHQAK